VPRVKRGTKRHAKRLKLLHRAKGYRLTKSKLYRSAKESVERALKFSYRDRRARKRDFRSLWIIRLNAAARARGLTYSQLMASLKRAKIIVDRKQLSELAIHDQPAFDKLVATALGRNGA